MAFVSPLDELAAAPGSFSAAIHASSPSTCSFSRACRSRRALAGSPGRPSGKPKPDFDAFSTALIDELAPASRLQEILADRVVLAAWQLDRITREEKKALASGAELGVMCREARHAEESLATALGLLASEQASSRTAWRRPAAPSKVAGTKRAALERDYPELSNEWPEVPSRDDPHDDRFAFAFDLDHARRRDHDDDDDTDMEYEGDGASWSGRLLMDENVSETSPVVKGTWVTASQVVSLIVDGWTWNDILRAHPELTEDDIRACLNYTVMQDDHGEIRA